MEEKRPVIDTSKLSHFVNILKDIYKARDEWAKLLGVDPSVLNLRARGNSSGMPAELRDPRNRYRDDYNYGNGEEYEWLEADIPMNGFIIELIQPEKGKGPFKEYFDKHGTGIQHIAFRIEGCDELNDILVKEGYEYIVDTHAPNGDRWSVLDTEDVLGTNLCIKPPVSELKGGH